MPRSSSRFRPLVLTGLDRHLLFSAVASAPWRRLPQSRSRAPIGSAPNASVMFASDGMRPDLMEKYAKAGSMPTYKELMKHGVTGDNGMLQAFPPNTGVGWYTMATGTYPSEHGSTNNTFLRAGDSFANRTSFSARGRAAGRHDRARPSARARRSRRSTGWRRCREHQGPTVDFATFFSNRGVLVGAANAIEQAGAASFGVDYEDRDARSPRRGWSNVPAGDPAATPKQTTWSIPSAFAAQNPNRTYNVYFYDSVIGGGVALQPRDRRARSARPARRPSVDLAVGDFKADQARRAPTASSAPAQARRPATT